MAIEIVVPRLGWSMDEGTFTEWLKAEGEWVNKGDHIFSIEGDKAVQEIESFDEGILRRDPNGPAPGEIVKVGQRLGYLAARDEVVDFSSTSSGESPSSAPVPISSSEGRPMTKAPAGPAARRLARRMGRELSSVKGSGLDGRIVTSDLKTESNVREEVVPGGRTVVAEKATPRARRTAKEAGVDWRGLAGSGRNGRVRERDVLSFLQRGPVATTQVAEPPRLPGRVVALTSVRRRIAQRLMASARETVPVTLTTTVDATCLVVARDRARSQGNAGISYNDLLIYLIGRLLPEHPQLTAQWLAEGLLFPDAVNIGLAMDVEDGLVVPVVRDVPSLSLQEIAETTAGLVQRARGRQLGAAEMRDGTFTITNLGAFGIETFTPVIQLPQSAILGVGSIRLEPAVVDGRIEPRQRMSLSLTFDHRVMDGAAAARFLQAARERIETLESGG